MQKKEGVKLYDGGLIALLVFVCILAVVAVGQRAKEVRRECEERLTRERRAIPYYSDDELITRYYQIGAILPRQKIPLKDVHNQQVKKQKRETTEKIYHQGKFIQCNFYAREPLLPGDNIVGPAVVEETTSGCFIPKGSFAVVDELRNLIIRQG